MDQSSWGRATSDTSGAIHSPWFWGAEVFVLVPLGGIVTGLLTSSPVWGALGGGVSALALLGLVFLFNLYRAPYRQRDEARAAIPGASPSSPILAAPQLHIRSLEDDFGEPGKTGYPQPKTDATRLLRIQVLLNPTNGQQVESVELEVQGKRIPSTWNLMRFLAYRPVSTSTSKCRPTLHRATTKSDLLPWPMGRCGGRQALASLFRRSEMTDLLPYALPLAAGLLALLLAPAVDRWVVWIDAWMDAYPSRKRPEYVR